MYGSNSGSFYSHRLGLGQGLDWGESMWTSRNNFYGSCEMWIQLLSHTNWQVVNAASRPVSPMSAGFGESAEDLESHIQTQVWLQVWNLRINTNWLSQDYLYIYLDLCSNLAFLIIRCNKWKGRCTLLWCICVFRLLWQGIEILSFHIPEEW